MSIRRVILESPYHDHDDAVVDVNENYAEACMLDSLRRGEAPYLSHLLYTRVLDDQVPAQRAWGLAAAQAWIIKADALVVYTDRGISAGMRAAIELATDELVPIEYRQLDAPWDSEQRP